MNDGVASLANTPIPLYQAYAKAWDEFNVRITARHSIINLYINLSVALLGLLIVSPSTNVRPLQIYAFYAMPTTALIASMLLFLHDLSMNNLIRYMVFCETRDPTFPSYHKIIVDKNGMMRGRGV